MLSTRFNAYIQKLSDECNNNDRYNKTVWYRQWYNGVGPWGLGNEAAGWHKILLTRIGVGIVTKLIQAVEQQEVDRENTNLVHEDNNNIQKDNDAQKIWEDKSDKERNVKPWLR